MTEFFSEKIMDAFSSMKTTDSISLDDVERLSKLEKYYVDPFHYVKNIIQDEDNFIIGRRGTGKSTLLYRAYIECLSTWNDEKRVYKPRILPLFIDLSQCTGLSDYDYSDVTFEEYFTFELIRNFRKYIYKFWGKIVPCDGKHIESPLLEDLDILIDDIETLIIQGRPILISSPDVEKKIVDNGFIKRQIKLEPNSFILERERSEENTREVAEKITTISKYTLGDFLDRLSQIKNTAKISSIYVFVDEYSELSRDNQLKLASLLKRLSGSRNGIYFKVAAITDNFNIGPIRLQRDFYEISLDFFKFAERSNSVNNAFENLETFTENIIAQRLNAYNCDVSLKKLFLNKDSISLIAKASVGIPRTIGIILKEAWNQALAMNKQYISLDELYYGINSAGDSYYAFFKGNVGLTIPRFYDDLWNDITARARNERKANPKKSAGLFLISSFRDNHFKFLSENYLVHLLKKGTETTVKGETAKSLYMIDFSFNQKYNLGFEIDRDTYRQQRFLYDDVLRKYDNFFVETRKIFKCPQCLSEYTEQQLFIPGLNTTLSFCPQDQVKLEKIEGKEFIMFDFTEEERKILGTIRNRTRNEPIFAREVAEIVGCNKHKVAKFVDKILDKNIVVRERLNGPNSPYSYFKLEEEVS